MDPVAPVRQTVVIWQMADRANAGHAGQLCQPGAEFGREGVHRLGRFVALPVLRHSERDDIVCAEPGIGSHDLEERANEQSRANQKDDGERQLAYHQRCAATIWTSFR